MTEETDERELNYIQFFKISEPFLVKIPTATSMPTGKRKKKGSLWSAAVIQNHSFIQYLIHVVPYSVPIHVFISTSSIFHSIYLL